MPQQLSNNARATLTGSITAGATSLTVEAGKADLFPVANTASWGAPANWFKATIIDNAGNYEIVYVGTRAGGSGTFSVLQRAQEGTTARSFAAGSIVMCSITALDVQNALAGIFPYIATTSGVDPKHEIIKTGSGAAAAMWHMVAGKMTLAQSDGVGNVVADRFTFDQTSGNFTAAGFFLTPSDERLKKDWKALPRNFIARLAEVKHGLYRKSGAKRLEPGVSAQSLREVLPSAVRADSKGMLAVNYQQAALVAAIALAQDNCDLRAELVDLTARLERLERRR